MESTKSFWEEFPGYTEHNFRKHGLWLLPTVPWVCVHKNHPVIKLLKGYGEHVSHGIIFPAIPLLDTGYFTIRKVNYIYICDCIQSVINYDATSNNTKNPPSLGVVHSVAPSKLPTTLVYPRKYTQ